MPTPMDLEGIFEVDHYFIWIDGRLLFSIRLLLFINIDDDYDNYNID